MHDLDFEGSRVVAMLGPTNTGKTHRAIQRMLEHPSGMMGLPLRLLAREVYDRVTAKVGEDAVALITGEERRIGRAARYYLCTVEAMPIEKQVSFLAIDEIQLAGDRNRGHVFTERLLNARGVRETWFMGSDTIETLLKRVIPTAEIRQNERFSKLSHKGPHKIASLPPRTALVAFSVERVYQLAEQIRRKHGGTAVVLGALSPRTRNAQVAMYQAGEVQYMVATDAIGMGLNMDVDHIAFDSLSKYDGREHRQLYPWEVAQIAGRAGRWRKDGSFGGTDEVGEMPPTLIEAIANHRFPALKKLYWRNTQLDLSSPHALLATLRRPPPWPFLVEAREEEDETSLRALVQDPSILKELQSEEEVRLLWDVCRIPDFRKTLTDSHHQLLKQVFLSLLEGPLPDDMVKRQIAHLNRPEGDVDALTTRLAWIRTWTYITHRPTWLKDAAHWQAEARTVEDRLSDALHLVLTERFVDPTARLLSRTEGHRLSEGQLRLGGQIAGELKGLYFRPASELPNDKRLERAIQAQILPEIALRLERLLSAPHSAIVRDGFLLRWEEGPLARLQAGPNVQEPTLKLLRNDLLSPGQVARLQRRLNAWLKDEIAHLLAPISVEKEGLRTIVRAILYRLQGTLGSLPRSEVEDLLQDLSDADWNSLKLLGVQVGEVHVFSRALLEPAALERRAALAAIALNMQEIPTLQPNLPERWYAWSGYWLAQGQIFRVDQISRIAERLRHLRRQGSILAEAILEVSGSLHRAEAVLQTLGWRKVEDRWHAPKRKK